jgi:hypothetical protein
VSSPSPPWAATMVAMVSARRWGAKYLPSQRSSAGNSALYTVVLTRLGRDQRTRTYTERRTSEGKSKKEIIRCLPIGIDRVVPVFTRLP